MTDFNAEIEKYKNEMMKFISQSRASAPSQPPPSEQPTERPEIPPMREPVERPEVPPMREPVERPEIPPMREPIPPQPTPEILPPPPPPQKGDNIVMDYTGFLQVKTYTALDALPVSDATVIISKAGPNQRELINMLQTNSSGVTPTVALPTVDGQMSEQPGFKTPFATYDIEVSKQGFIPIISRDVPIFANVKSVQNFEMIAVPEFDLNPQQTTITNTEPDL